MNKWIRRKRNSWGFGVQSPTDFHFVQHVLREEASYYGYADLRALEPRFSTDLPHYPENINRLLFRLTNYIHPEIIIEVGTGSGLSACAMALAHPLGKCVTIGTGTANLTEAQAALADCAHITVKSGNEIVLFEELTEKIEPIELLHIAQTIHYKEIILKALQHIGDKALIIIEGIRDNDEKRIWWKELRDNQPTGIYYDLGCIGLILFDKSRPKNIYWVDIQKK